MSNRSRREFVRCVAGGSLLGLAETRGFAKASIPLPRSILLSPEASLSEKWAAGELSEHLGTMTGVRLPVITSETIPDSPVIAVGGGAVTDRNGLAIPQGESCLLKTIDRSLVIAGGRQRGTMYGVFCFLEKLGCRWFTADVARIPVRSDFALMPFEEIVGPAFEYREIFFTEAQGREWSARNRLNGNFHHLDESVGGKISSMPFAHSFYALIPPDQYFATHPEYFALVAGRRRGKNAQLCLTNADVVNLATDGVQKWLIQNPHLSIVSVSQNDGAGWCECDPCQQVVRSEGGAVSGVLLRFVNQIAQRVAPSHPDKIIDTLAYQQSADPPAVVRPLPNVQIRFCPIAACQAHSSGTCVYNSEFEKQLAGWARIAPKLVLWQYSINFAHFLLPFPNETALVSDIERFQRAGVSGMFVEGAVSDGGGGENAELRAYLAGRLLWNPRIDATAETREFLRAVYGPAVAPMTRYYVLRQKQIRPNEHLWIDQNVNAAYLTPSFLREARDLLNQAHARADTRPIRRRIERCALSLDYIEVMRRRKCRMQGAVYGPDDAEKVRFDTANFVRRAESLGITHLREGYPLQAQAKAFDDSLKPYPAIPLDDGKRSIQIVPDLGARIIALIPSGGDANVLRVADPGEFAYPFAGGIHFSLTSDYASNSQQDVAWQSGTGTEPGTVLLRGKSEQSFELEMKIRVENGVLRVRVVATNRSPETQAAALRCQAEFAMGASREASLSYTTTSGSERIHRIERGAQPADGSLMFTGDQRPHEQMALLLPRNATHGIENRFHTEQIGQCGIRWSLRDSPHVNVILWSPEMKLAAGQKITLESDYRIT